MSCPLQHGAVRPPGPVHPGDVVVIEANVVRLRSRMGLLKGIARVNGKSVLEGTMTFALGPISPPATPNHPSLPVTLHTAQRTPGLK